MYGSQRHSKQKIKVCVCVCEGTPAVGMICPFMVKHLRSLTNKIKTLHVRPDNITVFGLLLVLDRELLVEWKSRFRGRSPVLWWFSQFTLSQTVHCGPLWSQGKPLLSALSWVSRLGCISAPLSLCLSGVVPVSAPFLFLFRNLPSMLLRMHQKSLAWDG